MQDDFLLGMPVAKTIRLQKRLSKGERLLIDATKPFDNPKSEEWFGLRFATPVYPDDDAMVKVRKKWDQYGITS